jgi:hypothetical protein
MARAAASRLPAASLPAADRPARGRRDSLLDVDHVLAGASLLLALLAWLLLALDARAAGVVVLAGAGLLCGLWGQMISRTRPERFLSVAGMAAAAVALAVGAEQLGV